MLEILNKPMYDEFFTMVENSSNSIKLCAPFIKSDIVNDIYRLKAPAVEVKVLTNMNLANFHRGVSDISAISTFLNNEHKVFNFPHLHAKFYIFDDTRLIITSANLTTYGLKKNLEYGVLASKVELVKTASNDFNRFCTNELAGKVFIQHTEKIANILDNLSNENIFLPRTQLDFPEDDIFTHDINIISSMLTGWQQAVFEELQTLSKQVFTTEDFTYIIPALKRRYPDNHHIEAKIRQQLQELRDIGLIKFIDRGVYKKLWI